MEYNHDDYTIRFARPEDLEALIQVEAECFPAAEAAGRESFQARLKVFPDSFLVAELADGGRIIGFINGAVTDARTISDDMFEKADLHNANGAYQSIFGLDVVEAFRRRGVGGRADEPDDRDGAGARKKGADSDLQGPADPLL